MWEVIYIAQNKEMLNKVRNLLENNGFLMQVSEVRRGEKRQSYEIRVTTSEAEDAYQVICDHMISA